MTEDEMVGWHHRIDGHEFEQAPGVGEGQGGLAYCSPWDHKQTQLKNNPFRAVVTSGMSFSPYTYFSPQYPVKRNESSFKILCIFVVYLLSSYAFIPASSF